MNPTPQIISSNDLVGTWGFDTGYRDRPDEVRIRFGADHLGTINPHDDAIDFKWSYDSSEGLLMQVGAQRHGPFRIEIIERDLPMGRYVSLISNASILPFGLRAFQKMLTPTGDQRKTTG